MASPTTGKRTFLERLTGCTCWAQGNAIRSLQGLQALTALTELDLRCNLLASYQEFSGLRGDPPPRSSIIAHLQLAMPWQLLACHRCFKKADIQFQGWLRVI